MKQVEKLLEIMATLRSPEGCPWDREQTHESIKSLMIEECYEVIDAIETGTADDLCEELGDVLLHVVFHCQLAREAGNFEFEKVVEGLNEKLIRRHPHVFDRDSAADSGEVLKKWDEIKRKEKPERKSVLEGIPAHLPGLMRAQEVQKKASKVGFDWDDESGPWDKVQEELAELKEPGLSQDREKEELGDLFFSLVNFARHRGLDAEECCRLAAGKFEKRFRRVEELAVEEDKPLKGRDLKELDHLWEKAKAELEE